MPWTVSPRQRISRLPPVSSGGRWWRASRPNLPNLPDPGARGDDVDPEQALSTRDLRRCSSSIRCYTAADLPARTSSGAAAAAATAGWDIRQHHADPDPAAVNSAILADLDNGVTSIWLTLGSGELSADDCRAHSTASTSIWRRSRSTPAPGRPRPPGSAGTRRLDGPGRGTLGLDPIGYEPARARRPTLPNWSRWPSWTRDHPALNAVTVDATVYHDAGGSDAQEVAIATAVGVAYLRALTDAGWDVGATRSATIEFRFAVTADQFASIAKLRAARRIWARVGELCGARSGRAVPAPACGDLAAMLTRRDPWVNMLRATIGLFRRRRRRSRCDHRRAVRLGDRLPGRLRAANRAQHPVDPARTNRAWPGSSTRPAGSWYVESRTDALAALGLGRIHRHRADRWRRAACARNASRSGCWARRDGAANDAIATARRRSPASASSR